MAVLAPYNSLAVLTNTPVSGNFLKHDIIIAFSHTNEVMTGHGLLSPFQKPNPIGCLHLASS